MLKIVMMGLLFGLNMTWAMELNSSAGAALTTRSLMQGDDFSMVVDYESVDEVPGSSMHAENVHAAASSSALPDMATQRQKDLQARFDALLGELKSAEPYAKQEDYRLRDLFFIYVEARALLSLDAYRTNYGNLRATACAIYYELSKKLGTKQAIKSFLMHSADDHSDDEQDHQVQATADLLERYCRNSERASGSLDAIGRRVIELEQARVVLERQKLEREAEIQKLLLALQVQQTCLQSTVDNLADNTMWQQFLAKSKTSGESRKRRNRGFIDKALRKRIVVQLDRDIEQITLWKQERAKWEGELLKNSQSQQAKEAIKNIDENIAQYEMHRKRHAAELAKIDERLKRIDAPAKPGWLG